MKMKYTLTTNYDDEEELDLSTLSETGFWYLYYSFECNPSSKAYIWIDNITLLELQKEIIELQKILNSQEININIVTIIFKNLF